MSGLVDEIVAAVDPATELGPFVVPSNSAVVLGLDIGTSGVRAALFDEEGNELDESAIRLQRHSSALDDFSSLDPFAALDLVIEAIDLMLAQPIASAAQIEIISISCFWHSLLGIDSRGEPTTPVLGWAETRAAAAAKNLRARFNETQSHGRTGCRFHPSYWPAKLLWLKTEQPLTFKKTTQWLSFSEFVTLKLFGVTSISVSMASGTGLLNQHTCEWDGPLLQELDVPLESLAEISESIVVQAKLLKDYIARWPQLSKARLAPAIGDGAASNIGSGCTTLQEMALTVGTSAAGRILYEGYPPETVPAELWCYRADRSRVLIGGALSDGGGLYRWLQEMFSTTRFSLADQDLEEMGPDEHGLTILPFWAGERSTGWSLDAKGGILGLTVKTTPREILRAAMEAVAYRLALIVRALDSINPNTNLIASGYALQSSSLWLQIISDVIGRPIGFAKTSEASARGAALLALEAMGKIATIEVAKDGANVLEDGR